MNMDHVLVRLNTKDIQDLVDKEDIGKIETKVNELFLSGDFASAERRNDFKHDSFGHLHQRCFQNRG